MRRSHFKSLGFQINWRETIALVFAQPHSFVFFNIDKNSRYNQCFVQNDTFLGWFCQISGWIFLGHPLLVFSEGGKKKWGILYALGPGDHSWGRFLFRFVVFESYLYCSARTICIFIWTFMVIMRHTRYEACQRYEERHVRYQSDRTNKVH